MADSCKYGDERRHGLRAHIFLNAYHRTKTIKLKLFIPAQLVNVFQEVRAGDFLEITASYYAHSFNYILFSLDFRLLQGMLLPAALINHNLNRSNAIVNYKMYEGCHS